MSGIRTMSAAELLGVSPRALRDWERRFGYPKPRRTPAGHREYDLAELEPLRQALMEAHSVAAAIELARRRGTWPSSPARLLEAFGHFDEALADRVMEESLTFRSVDRSVDSVRVQAFELGLRRASMHTVLLRCSLPAGRVTSAIRRIDPMALVICGGGVRDSTVERLEHAVRHADCGAPLYELSESAPDPHTDRLLGPGALEATKQLRAYAVRQAGHPPRTGGPRA